MRLRALMIWLTTAVSAIGATVAITAPAAGAPQGCPKLYVLAIPGTWADGTNPGILGDVTAGLGAEIAVQFVGYDATAFPWEKAVYGKSKAQAVANTTGLARTMLNRCPRTRIAVVGYSQGADAAGDFASEVGTGRAAIRPSAVAGVVLISDPRRSARDNLVGPPLRGEGSGGPRLDGMGWVSPRAFTICEPGDLYCNVPQDYFLTRIVGYLAETSDPTPSQIGQYQAEAGAIITELLTLGGPGKIVEELSNARAREQITSFNRFLQSGAHSNYATFQVRPGVTAVQWAHNHLARLA
ncbi:cutinase family protein [Gordonia aquimaris]|uniref:Cutinase family protein n=1 Tax=Gordonia aquimaris TaxID=2984863 RepID=A0A9X3D6S7_9ACTN|nr:cutinase family protein [Gordonia aquimaris]MCX2965963.1 cutinase family protein [Gordonia aquimaris]